MRSILAGGTVLLLLAAIAPRNAPPRHFELSRSVPEAFDTVRSVSEVQLWFTEVPLDRTTRIRLLDESDDDVRARALRRDARDYSWFTLPLLRPLSPGKYTVSWEAQGPDGHSGDGYFLFWVAEEP